MPDGASVAAITGATGVLIALVGHFNTRRQIEVSIATVEQQTALERARLDAQLATTAAERAEQYRLSRIDAYRAYIEISFEFMAMGQGVEPLTRESWRDWRKRVSAATSLLELVCSDTVFAAVDRFDSVAVEICRGCLTDDAWDEEGFLKSFRASADFLAAHEAVIQAMRLETAPRD